ncbi:MAG: divergent PAP2 family protein [Treponema sp.]|jgi:acid phosphatase family membrane protein YuiD|nr:divergent PAP2 family protein [Treponema sp.]
MAFPISQAESLKALIETPLFLAPLSSWIIAQILKMLVFLLRGKHRSGRELLETVVWRTGGMPSSHAALVTALTVSAAYRAGFNSDLFIVSLFFALIIMRDAMGVRRSSGLQARALNSLGRQLAEREGIEYHPVKEVHGHTPMEVVVGALLGFFIAAAYEFL